eukprot:CAMPEP_0198352860 /NCGR_PEP_ID=MMETSP1450-20131203/109005_1 /TAXON_ID=753684 ORGANISM="Madagascaria erythrocladiodes, Strain CCMP3234" /NCGR_SAMPLE_ID=MMETSP1450 /ASSEMBLY_ACC=CAM_ASM_001115 /LENGTH=164 /DNA_ID=CAMNT_0044058939 /DNA_START=113 /DNA_END=603 /DNA_ORIENTATION=-
MTMRIIEEKRINVGCDAAWDLLAENFRSPETYSADFVLRSELLPGPTRGLGTKFRLHLRGGAYVEEEVVAWVEGRSITTRTVSTHRAAGTEFTKTIGVLPILGEEKSYLYVHLTSGPRERSLVVRGFYQKTIRRSLRAFEELHTNAPPRTPALPWRKSSAALQV